MIPIMIIEPTATTTEQIASQSSSTAITAARPLRFLCAKRHPATPIRKLRLAPSSGGFYQRAAHAGYSQFGCPWIKVNNRKHADFACRSAVSGARRRAAKTEFKAAWEALKARTAPEQLAVACKAMNIRGDG
jgi:hypothetical protein